MLTANFDADTLDGGWENVDYFIVDALLIAWDECHKIYLAMDQAEAAWFRESYPCVVEDTAAVMLATLHDWYDQSCGLRFINAVYHNEADPNAGFITLISQFANDDDDDDEMED